MQSTNAFEEIWKTNTNDKFMLIWKCIYLTLILVVSVSRETIIFF